MVLATTLLNNIYSCINDWSKGCGPCHAPSKKEVRKSKSIFFWTLWGTPPISVSIFNDKSSTANLNLLMSQKNLRNSWKGMQPTSKSQMGNNCPVARKCFFKACTWPMVRKEAEDSLIMGRGCSSTAHCQSDNHLYFIETKLVTTLLAGTTKLMSRFLADCSSTTSYHHVPITETHPQLSAACLQCRNTISFLRILEHASEVLQTLWCKKKIYSNKICQSGW
jgi:hypothetical protein